MKIKTNFLPLIAVLIVLILYGPAIAGEKKQPETNTSNTSINALSNNMKTNGDNVAEIDEMVVTASRIKEKKIETTSNITIIDEKDIKASAAENLGDLLAEKGIGHIQEYPGVLTTIGIRGFRTETHGNDLMGHVLILLNGHRAGTGNVAKIMTKNIERIEIVRGPASVQYGSAAMGGVINVITKQGKNKPHGFVETTLGSFNSIEGSAGLSGKIKNFDFSGSFTHKSRDDYDTANGDRYHNTKNNHQKNTSINVGYEFLPGNRIGIIYQNFNADDVGSPGYFYKNDLDDYIDTSNHSIDFIYNGRSSQGIISWMARYFNGKDKNKWINPAKSDPDGFDAWYPLSFNNTDYKGCQAQVSYNQENFVLTTGFDWANYKIHTSWSPNKSEYNNPAGFVLAKVKALDERLIINGGMRYDEYKVDMKDQGGTQNDHHITSNIGMAYILTNYMKLRVNYGEAFKMPAADQLAADYASFMGKMKGNPNLDPEKSKTYEGGIDIYRGALNSSLTYFHTDFDDKIETYTTSGGDTSWKNTKGASIEGIEGQFSYDVGSSLSLNYHIKPYINFVYLTKYKDDNTNQDLKYTEKYHASYGITITDSKGLTANLNFAYTGEKKIDDYQSSAWPKPVITTGGFTIADLNISKKIINFKNYGDITLKASIKNLFNKEYAYVQGYPMPGRSFFLGIKYDF